MTIQSTVSRVVYAGAGTTGPFAIPFLFYAATDLTLQTTSATGVITTLVLNVDYTLTGVGVVTGGTATTTATVAVGAQLAIFLNPPLTQLSAYVDGQPFPSATVQQDLDREVQISQRLQAQINFAVRAPDADNTPSMVLPAAVVRAGQYLSFDGAGNAIVASGVGTDTSLRADLANTTTAGKGNEIISYRRTAAEIAASVTPTNYWIPSHLACGVVLPERYGGAADNSTLNDTAHTNAMKVANAMGDGTVVYGGGSLGIWKFNAPITVGAAGQGRRVIGAGSVAFSFNAAIANTLDLVTLSADLSSAYKDQPQFDNIQIQCNGGGRYGLVLTVGNRPLIRNVRVINSGSDGFAEIPSGTNWIEKAQVFITLLNCGRHGWRQELNGTAGQNPYINEGNYYVEVRGVSAITAGGTARKVTGSAGLGGAAKISDNHIKSIFDAIYNTAALVPATSPMVIDTVTVQNDILECPAWENTGTGGNPGAGPLIKVTSGGWSGQIIGPNWNSLWGDGTLDAAITAVNRLDFSFPAKNQLMGTLAIKGSADNQTVAALSGNTTTGTAADLSITRTGAASALIGQNAGILLGNSTSGTFAAVQEYNGTAIIFTFASGAWGERARIKADGSLSAIQIGGLSSIYSVTGGAPSGGTGSNGDFAFRQDGGAGTSIYMKRAGAWVGIV